MEWHDARSTGGWWGAGDLDNWISDWKQYTIQSYGYLIKADKLSVVLSMSKDLIEGDASVVHSLLEIPRPMVRAIYSAKQGKKIG